MNCDKCQLHITYLERIISLQRDEIEYIKSICFSRQITKSKEIKEISHSVFDIIDNNIEQLDVTIFLQRIECKYPANTILTDIIKETITYSDYTLIIKEKSNIVKYLNQNNNVMFDNIEKFSKEICEYIFVQLKPIVESNMLNDFDDELENTKENNRIQNIMLLKDSKFVQNAIVSILSRLD